MGARRLTDRQSYLRYHALSFASRGGDGARTATLARAATAGVGARRRCRGGGHGARRRGRSGHGGALRLRAAMSGRADLRGQPLCGVGPAADRADATRDQATTTAARPGRLGLHQRAPAGRPTSARQRTPARRSARALSAADDDDARRPTRHPATRPRPVTRSRSAGTTRRRSPTGSRLATTTRNRCHSRPGRRGRTTFPRAPRSRRALVPGQRCDALRSRPPSRYAGGRPHPRPIRPERGAGLQQREWCAVRFPRIFSQSRARPAVSTAHRARRGRARTEVGIFVVDSENPGRASGRRPLRTGSSSASARASSCRCPRPRRWAGCSPSSSGGRTRSVTTMPSETSTACRSPATITWASSAWPPPCCSDGATTDLAARRHPRCARRGARRHGGAGFVGAFRLRAALW